MEESSSAPVVAVVPLPTKWQMNQPRKPVPFGRRAGVPVGGGGGASPPAPPASAPPPPPPSSGEEGRGLTSHLESWIERVGLVLAPREHFVRVAALHALYAEDRDADPDLPSDDPPVPLETFSSVVGQVLRRAFPPADLADVRARRRKGMLAVTCERLPATRLNWPPKRTDRKARRLERYGPRDPERSRDVLPNEGPTYARYVNEMLRLGCAPELLRLRLFPDAKELTETFAVHEAVRSRLGGAYPLTDDTVTLVAVGDGNTPRTAALFAFLTRWHCVSIDPEMAPWREWRARKLVAGPEGADSPGDGDGDGDEGDGDGDGDGRWGGVRRLSAFRRKMQEVTVDCDRAVLVLVHAHVSLADCLAGVRTRTGQCAAVIMPCCNWYASMRHPDGASAPTARYDDPAVVSPHREVRVFETLPCGVSARFGGGGEESQAVACGACDG